MHTLSVASAVLALVFAVFWTAVGVSGLVGRLERNRWIGVRSDETMRSAEAFALGNKVAAPGFLAAALVLLIGGVLALGGQFGFLFGFGAVLVGFVIAAVAAGVGVRAAATVPEPEEESNGCTSGCCSDGSDEQSADACGTADDPAADCGASSCGSCALQGMCTTEHATDTAQPVDATR